MSVWRFRRQSLLLMALGLVLAAAGLGWGLTREGEWTPPAKIRIGTASSGGAYWLIGSGLAQYLGERFPGSQVVAEQTQGSIDNVDRLARGELDLALVQSDVLKNRRDIRTLAVLYEERIHLIVGDAKFDALPASVRDLEGKRVAIGPPGSGTRGAVQKFLDHFGVSVEDSYRKLGLTSTAGARTALVDGDIDAMFVCSGVPDRTVASILNEGGFTLVDLATDETARKNMEGFHTHVPGYVSSSIRIGDYKEVTERRLNTVAVKALLVARKDIDERLAYEVLQVLFSRKYDLQEKHPLAFQIKKKGNEFDDQPFGPHPGAVDYFSGIRPVKRSSTASFAGYGVGLLGLALAVGCLVSERRRVGLLRQALADGHFADDAAPQPDLFLSYPSKSAAAKRHVETIASTLDDAGVKCWYAPRDIRAGEKWSDAIPSAIERTRHGLVMIHCKEVYQSEHVVRELHLAAQAKLKIFLYRIEDLAPSGAIGYHVSNVHWLDVFQGPEEKYLGWLIKSVRRMREGDDGANGEDEGGS